MLRNASVQERQSEKVNIIKGDSRKRVRSPGENSASGRASPFGSKPL